MASWATIGHQSRFLWGFSIFLLIGLSLFWFYYQKNGLPGIRFPYLQTLEEPDYAAICELEGVFPGEVERSTLSIERPILVWVWLKPGSPLRWEQWMHLASIMDHEKMDLITVVIASSEGLKEEFRHAQQIGIPESTEYVFVEYTPEELNKLFSGEFLESEVATWVYLYENPVFAVRGRVVPPWEWLSLLDW